MDHTEIEELQVVDRYLMGKLPEADAGRFEEHYLGCPRCLDELEVVLVGNQADFAEPLSSLGPYRSLPFPIPTPAGTPLLESLETLVWAGLPPSANNTPPNALYPELGAGQ